MADTNGTPKQPALFVFWDEATQTVAVQPNPSVVKSLAFGKALLVMAGDLVDQQLRFQQVAAMQQRAVENAENQRLAQKVLHGR